MSVGQATPRSLDEVLADYKRRLISLERRLPAPPRSALGPAGQRVANWNDAVNAGFYWSDASAGNRPYNVSWLVGVVTRNAMPGFERIVQEVRIPSLDRMRNAWIRIGYWVSGVLTWSAWRRTDRICIATSATNCTLDGNTGRYNLTAGTQSWSFNGMFTAEFRAYRILFQTYTGDANGVYFRFRSAGADNATAAAYQTQTLYISGTGTPAGTLSSDSYACRPGNDAQGFHGEIVVAEPNWTTGNQKQKRYRAEIAGFGNAGVTLNYGALSGFDLTAYDGFTFGLFTSAGKNGIGAGAEAWISVEGIS